MVYHDEPLTDIIVIKRHDKRRRLRHGVASLAVADTAVMLTSKIWLQKKPMIMRILTREGADHFQV